MYLEKYAVKEFVSDGVDCVFRATYKQQALEVLDTGMANSVNVEELQDIRTFPDCSCGEPLQLIVYDLHITLKCISKGLVLPLPRSWHAKPQIQQGTKRECSGNQICF